MSGANRLGPLVTMNMVRTACVGMVEKWLPDYIADACQAEGVARTYVAAPRAWRTPATLSKWPEDQLPCVLVVSPGLREKPRRMGDGKVWGKWVTNLSAVVQGVDEADTQLQASVYGAALRSVALQHGGDLAGLTVEGVEYEDEAYDALPQDKARSLVAASVTVSITIRDIATFRPGLRAPTAPPIGDPGPYPAAHPVTVRETQT